MHRRYLLDSIPSTAGASTDLVRQGYGKNAAANKLDPLLDSLRAQPGVLSGALGPLPLTGFMQTVIKVEGHESAEKDWVHLTRVSPGYFSRSAFLSSPDAISAVRITLLHPGWL